MNQLAATVNKEDTATMVRALLTAGVAVARVEAAATLTTRSVARGPFGQEEGDPPGSTEAGGGGGGWRG